MWCARCATADPRTTSVVIAERASPVRTGSPMECCSEAAEAPCIEVQDSGDADQPISDSADGPRDGAAVATADSASKTPER